jgi:methionyl aminopeptidase
MGDAVVKPKQEEEGKVNGFPPPHQAADDDGDEPDDDVAGEGEPGAGGNVTHPQLHEQILTKYFDHLGEGKKKKKKKKPKKKKLEQSDPPRIGISKFFPDGIYPEGEIQPYKDECVDCSMCRVLQCLYMGYL